MENKKGGDLICRRPETIVEARFSLTKKQNDVLDMVFASIENDDNLQYEIDISKYAKLYNIQDKSNIYGDVKKTVRTFEGKGFSVTQKISEKKENRIYFAWFSSINYLGGEGKIIIELGQTLKKLLLSAKKACFYQIKYPINFTNIYSKRIYYYLKSFEDTGWRVDNLDSLRSKLECPKSYNRYADFRKHVLTPAFEEINGESDILFKYEELKTKRKVTGIKFYVKTNKPKISNKNSIKFPVETAEEEVSATLIEPEEENSIKKIMFIMQDSNITTLEAKKIIDTANGDIDIIKEKYGIVSQMKKVGSVVATMIDAIKNDYQAPKGKVNGANGSFNDYEQRAYDFDELEKKLLGWDKQ